MRALMRSFIAAFSTVVLVVTLAVAPGPALAAPGDPPRYEYTLTFNVAKAGKYDLALAYVQLTAGQHRLTFTVTGKQSASPRYGFGLDAILLDPAP